MPELQRKTIYVGNSYQGYARYVPIILDAVEVRQEINNNRTLVKATLRKEQVYDSNYAYSQGVNSTLQGTSLNIGAMYFDTSTIQQTKEFWVDHNNEGIGFVDISASLNTSYGNVSLSGRLKCTKIARASSLVATDAYIESASILSISRAVSTFTHTITFEFVGLSGTIATKTSETTLGFTIPSSFYEKIPNAKSGKCKFYITTFSGDTQIGEIKTTEITVTCSEDKCKPSVLGTVVDYNVSVTALTGSKDNLIKFFSNALCSIIATSKNSSTIISKKIYCGDGKAITDSGTINKVESGIFTLTTTDSRGFTNSIEIIKEMINYITLTANLSFNRPVATENVIKIQGEGNYYKGSFGAVSNEINAKYRYRNKTDNGIFTDWVTIPITISNTEDRFLINYTTPAVIPYDKVCEIEYIINDKLHTINKTIEIIKGKPVFDWGESDFNFNVDIMMNGITIFSFVKEE